MELSLFDKFMEVKRVETDTRKDVSNTIFFALKGENFNGNDYALQAIDAGARYAVVDEDIDVDNPRIIKVDDVLAALQRLAISYRQHLNIPVIAITGSNGKTTTKELVSTVLSKKYQIHATKGNLNNHIGVPLTILSCDSGTELIVLEMGASAIGEIDKLCHIGQPTHGVITNIGEAHLEGFGSIEGVKRGKSELYQYLESTDGVAFVNVNEDNLYSLSEGVERILYGDSKVEINKNYHGTLISSIPNISCKIEYFLNDILKSSIEVDSILSGDYNYQNILTAGTIGLHFGVYENDIRQAIQSYIPSNNRSQVIEIEQNTVILDAYNANPSSMMKAVKNFLNLPTGNKILILGSMKELGKYSDKAHHGLIEFLNNHLDEIEMAYVIGEEYSQTINDSKFVYCKNVSDLKKIFKIEQFQNRSIFIKGSRSNQLEQLIYDDKMPS